MSDKPKRSVLFNVNRFQKSVLWPVLIPCITLSVLSLICLSYFCLIIDQQAVADQYNLDLSLFQVAVPWFLGTFSLLILFIVFWICRVTNQIVGPYDRIVKELDQIIESKEKRPLSVRQGDEMFEELTKRINRLIEKPNS